MGLLNRNKIRLIICSVGSILGFIALIIIGTLTNVIFESHYGEIYLLFSDDYILFGFFGILTSGIGTILPKSRKK